MNSSEFFITGEQVVLPEGVRPAAIHVRDGKIAAVTSFSEIPKHVRVENAGDLVVMPGLVDTHVHINEPGRTEWEGFETATRAAAAGGVTTLIEMPLNSIPATTTVKAYEQKIAAAKGKCHVHMGFWGGVVPGNTSELRGLWEAGVFGFKCFLVDSGVPEFAAVTEKDLREAMPVLAKLGAPLLVHAEMPGPIEKSKIENAKRTGLDTFASLSAGACPTKHETWLKSRPREAEHEAIALMIELGRELQVRVHIVHLSSADALQMLQEARSGGVPITVETCPHYLTFCAEDIPDGATEYKCAPPIRERENRERLWNALRERQLDFVATDHSPAPPEMKCKATGDFMKAWGGIASLQLSLPAMWTEASKRGFGIGDLVKWMCVGPARLADLIGQKGEIAEGRDADFVIWDSEGTFEVEAEILQHRHKLTPYAGMKLRGMVKQTYVRGTKVFDAGNFPSAASGVILRRS